MRDGYTFTPFQLGDKKIKKLWIPKYCQSRATRALPRPKMAQKRFWSRTAGPVVRLAFDPSSSNISPPALRPELA